MHIYICMLWISTCIIAGDRIAIISRGSLLCCGSFEYLKHKFGHGHRLTFVAKSRSERTPSVSSHTFNFTAEVEDEDHVIPYRPMMSIDSIEPFSDNTEQKLTSFLQSLIAGASLVEKRGRELHFLLPLLQARPNNLARLFAELEQQKASLGIASYGMTACSMEEVCFTKCVLCVQYVRQEHHSSFL